MIYLLFGEMGVGKNYVGERLAKYHYCQFYDGDLSLTPEMKEKVKNFGVLPDDMLDRFVEKLITDVRNRMPIIGYMVVGQALYKEKHRQRFVEVIKDVKLIRVVPPSLRVHMSRIMTRPRGLRWAAYCLLSKPFFQKPGRDVDVIVNDTDDSIDRQIREIVIGK
jgi:gluconate kinase